MPETKFVALPYNMVEDKRFKNKSIYVSDFCSRRRHIPERLQMKTKETQIYANNIYNPTSRFLNDHFQTTSHRELKFHCEKILNTIERSSSRNGVDINIGKDKRAPLYNSLPVTPMITDDDQPLIDVLPLSMRRIESAWQDEVITTKRERGDIYGKAGAKKWYHQREKEDQTKLTNKKLMPGLSKWLNEANEYEKVVVHDFMKNVSNAIGEEGMPAKNKTIQENSHVPHFSENPKIEDYLDFIPDQNEAPDFEPPLSPPPLLEDDPNFPDGEQFLQMPNADLSQERHLDEVEAFKNVTFRNPTRETIVSKRDLKSPGTRCLSRASSASMLRDTSSKTNNFFQDDSLEQRPISLNLEETHLSDLKRSKSSLGLYNEKPSDKARPSSTQSSSTSVTRLINRAKSAEIPPSRIETPERVQRVYSAGTNRSYKQHHHHHHKHSESNCKSCQEREIRKMADKLASMEPKSYKMLKEEMAKRPKMAISKMYKPSSKDYDLIPDDFVYTNSVFGKVTTPGKGHFIIHPEWVSEKAKPKKSYR